MIYILCIDWCIFDIFYNDSTDNNSVRRVPMYIVEFNFELKMSSYGNHETTTKLTVDFFSKIVVD